MRTGCKIVGRLAAVPSTTVSAVKLGAIVGGAISIFQNALRVSRGRIGPGQAATNVVKDTVGTGLSTAAGVAVVTGMGIGGLFGHRELHVHFRAFQRMVGCGCWA